jgi:hypothetical protein
MRGDERGGIPFGRMLASGRLLAEPSGGNTHGSCDARIDSFEGKATVGTPHHQCGRGTSVRHQHREDFRSHVRSEASRVPVHEVIKFNELGAELPRSN